MTNDKFYKLPQELTARKDLTASAKIIYAVIMDHLGNNKDCWPGKRKLVKKTGLSGDTVCNAIQRLESVGALVVDRRGNGRSNHYKTGLEIRPVRKSNRSENQTGGGQKTRPEAVRKSDPNQTDPLNQTSNSRARKKFKKPSVMELQNYSKSIGFDLDAEYFIDTYEANGWTVGKDKKMKDWKATVRNWKRREKDFNNERKKTTANQRKPKSFAEQKSNIGYSVDDD